MGWILSHDYDARGRDELVQFPLLPDSYPHVRLVTHEFLHRQGLVWQHIAHGAEDETGDQPLANPGRRPKHAGLSVGLSSSWAYPAASPR